jgi:SRSO17 transposase
MEVKDIKAMGRKLKKFLSKFDDCFGRSEPRANLETIVQGQLSGLERKSLEPIALAAGVAPRTLQDFVASGHWDHERLRDQGQELVAMEHAHPRSIGLIDESGNPKKGNATCGVYRQWCGNRGKVDNCVVGVHLGYTVGDFQCLLDSDIFLPEAWADDRERRQKTQVPEEVVFRTKPEMALSQVQRALGNGIRFWSFTFDELYGRSGPFLDGLLGLGQNFVGEIPCDFVGWVQAPQILIKPTPAETRKRGRQRHFPRLSRKSLPACEVRNLAKHSRVFTQQTWQRYRIKDGEKGPMVWEVKSAPFYRKQGKEGLPKQAHTLIVARKASHPEEIKYFLANQSLPSRHVTLKDLLWVAFSRWPIERCFEIGKRDLGMDHFEMRQWVGIHRHFYISQLTQLFCAQVQQALREKNADRSLSDGRTGSLGRQCLDYSSTSETFRPIPLLSKNSRCDKVSPDSQSRFTCFPLERSHKNTRSRRHQYQ